MSSRKTLVFGRGSTSRFYSRILHLCLISRCCHPFMVRTVTLQTVSDVRLEFKLWKQDIVVQPPMNMMPLINGTPD